VFKQKTLNIAIIAMTKTTFLGGSLSFKGDKKRKSKKRSNRTKHKMKEEVSNKAHLDDETRTSCDAEDNDDELTEAERKALILKQERQKEESKRIASKSHRERVEELNEKLGSLTEHNDIPRVSAAGNG
jgi:protein FAM32A